MNTNITEFYDNNSNWLDEAFEEYKLNKEDWNEISWYEDDIFWEFVEDIYYNQMKY